MTNAKRFTDFLEDSTETRTKKIEALYAESITFQDPLNRAKTRAHFIKIDKDLYKQLQNISFKVISTLEQDSQVFSEWEMTYSFRKKIKKIGGISTLLYDSDQKIIQQRDYWDASLPIYGEFPPLGFFIRSIQKMLAVKA